MRVAVVSMVKDEADIIELFARACLQWADHLYVVDNGSSDATEQILCALQDEGLPLTLWRYPSIDYQQSIITTAALRRVALTQGFGWVIPLDADEFLQEPADRPLRSILPHVPQGHVLALPWRTYVPLTQDWLDEEAPLTQCFGVRAFEPRSYHKVCVPVALARSGTLSMGNHEFMLQSGAQAPMVASPVTLAHVPVRSAAQLMVKSLVGSHKYSIKSNRRSGEGYHWDGMAQMVRQQGYRLSLGQLQSVALAYATQTGDRLPPAPLEAAPILSPEPACRHRDLARIDLCARLDAFAAQLCQSLGATAGP